VLEFNFPIKDVQTSGSASGNKTVLLLCIGRAILWTCVDEVLRCTFWPPPSSDRKSVLKWIDSFANEAKQTDGPVLVTKSLQERELRVLWLFQPNHESCQDWARQRLIGHVGQSNLGELVLSRMRQELGNGSSGLAMDWGTHFDSIAPGY
jgi:hypothetical protein